MPFHGTFFFSRGGPGTGEADGLPKVAAGKDAARHSGNSLGGGVGPPSSAGVEFSFPITEPITASSSAADILGREGSEKSACFNVAVLFLLGAIVKTSRNLSRVSKNRFNVGVLGSSCPSQFFPSPEMDPLIEECSLSPGSSLNHALFSADSPPVCWRIQSSVNPCAGRLARFAKTAALIRPSCETKSGSVCDLVNIGAGRKKGVWNSR